ncbi:MAG: anion permease [Legionellales bacterium]|nr:MAG: anion permease [Legionellales bacterium]
MNIELAYLVLALSAGFFMAWGIGANDVANAMGTSVGSRAISIKQAIIIAAIFEFLGAIVAGGEVTSTIKAGIVNPDSFATTPDIFIMGMLAALFATAIWLLIASLAGWPVSTTHTIVGAIIGFGLASMHGDAIVWGNISYIMLSWLVSPCLGGVIAYLIFFAIQKFIFSKQYSKSRTKKIKAILKKLMIITACIMAFTHGSNDVANAIGPVSAIIGMLSITQDLQLNMPLWISVLGACGIVIGLTMYGHKVIATVGNGITQLTPITGFAITMAAALTVAMASIIGMPVSTTHTVVGAILGIGLARGIAAINLSAIRSIFLSWIITLPVGAILAAIIFKILQLIFC